MKQKFKVDYMVLHREDLKSITENSQKISDQQMERIANKLGRLLASDWDILLNSIKESYPELFEVEE